MGKHKNTSQEAKLIAFMETHKDLARGFTKGDRVVADALWNDLKNELNSHGPPQKDANGWKKVWTDWKASIRKKLSHNKAEDISTGGGPFNQFVISPTEDAVAKICGIYTVVDGIANTFDFGLEEDDENWRNNSQEVLPEMSEPASTSCRKRKSPASANDNLHQFMNAQNEAISKIGDKIENGVEASNKSIRVAKDIERTIRKLQKSVETLSTILVEKNGETLRHNFEMEKLRKEELLLKKRKIELKEIEMKYLSRQE